MWINVVDKNNKRLISYKEHRAIKLLKHGIAKIVNKNPLTIQVNWSIDDDNKYAIKMKKIMSNRLKNKERNKKVTIFCSGGCGRSITLRKSKIEKCDYYICNSKIDRQNCEEFIPKPEKGMFRIQTLNAAGSFIGISNTLPTKDDINRILIINKIRDANSISYIKQKTDDIIWH